MKKFLSATFLTLGTLIGACGLQTSHGSHVNESVTPDSRGSEHRLTRVDSDLIIELEENADQDFHWDVSDLDNNFLQLKSKEKLPASGAVGASGRVIFKLTAKKIGTTSLSFKLKQTTSDVVALTRRITVEIMKKYVLTGGSFCRQQPVIYGGAPLNCLTFSEDGTGVEIVHFEGQPYKFPLTYKIDGTSLSVNSPCQVMKEDRVRVLQLKETGDEVVSLNFNSSGAPFVKNKGWTGPDRTPLDGCLPPKD